jgi:hypothetical protein
VEVRLELTSHVRCVLPRENPHAYDIVWDEQQDK